MILDIFLPEKIRGIRLRAIRVAGFHVQDETVCAVQAHLGRSKTIVEKIFVEKIKPGPEPVAQRTTGVLQTIIKKLNSCDQIRASIPASLVVVKELTLPFLDRERIRMVVDYEIEGMLPFPIDNALIDFIIIEQLKTEKKSKVLAVAIRLQDVEKVLETYRQAGIEPAILTVDLLDWYGLSSQIPDYQKIAQASALIEIGNTTTKIAFLDDGHLRFVRNMPRGIDTIAQDISKECSLQEDQIKELLTKNGLQKTDNADYDKALDKHITDLFNDIQFTLNSFLLRLKIKTQNYTIKKILLSGAAIHLKGMMEFCASSLQVPTEPFATDKIFSNKMIKNKTSLALSDWQVPLFALGCALPNQELSDFNLRRKSLTFVPDTLIKKQWITGSVLTLILLLSLSIPNILYLRNLAHQEARFEKKELDKLKHIFPRDAKALKQSDSLKKLLKAAEVLVEEREEMWAPFSQHRLRPLEILFELTRLIDRDRFDVTVDEVSITSQEGTPIIEVTGFFRSKTGAHFQDFGIFQKIFHASKTLTLLEEIDPTLVDDMQRVKFTARLKQKEV